MKCVKIGNLNLGEGIPKICVPIVGAAEAEIRAAAAAIVSLENPPDLVEWRADWYEHIFDWQRANELVKEIREQLKEIPLLFTFRTKNEGGEREIEWNQYQELLCHAAQSGYVDAVDVEAFSFGNPVEGLVEQLHREQMVVIGSSHDFQQTPETEEMVRRLYEMRDFGMDLAKLAVMPRNAGDVQRLLAATCQVASDSEMCPIITMSMSGQGLISRMSGEIFGSVLTFASAGRASAPGQIEMGKLRQILAVIHENQ